MDTSAPAGVARRSTCQSSSAPALVGMSVQHASDPAGPPRPGRLREVDLGGVRQAPEPGHGGLGPTGSRHGPARVGVPVLLVRRARRRVVVGGDVANPADQRVELQIGGMDSLSVCHFVFPLTPSHDPLAAARAQAGSTGSRPCTMSMTAMPVDPSAGAPAAV